MSIAFASIPRGNRGRSRRWSGEILALLRGLAGRARRPTTSTHNRSIRLDPEQRLKLVRSVLRRAHTAERHEFADRVPELRCNAVIETAVADTLHDPLRAVVVSLSVT